MAPKRSRPKLPPGSLSISHYTHLHKTFSSQSEAYEDLGISVCCKGHAARVLKTSSKVTYLGCRLGASSPPCLWHAMLHETPDGGAEMYYNGTLGKEHVAKCALQGKIGFESLAERSKLAGALSATATARPTLALYSARTEGPVEGRVRTAQLKQVQRLRKTISSKLFCGKKLGDMAATVQSHSAIPASDVQGYFCFSYVGRDAKNKPKVTAVATCKRLEFRFAQAGGLTAHIDGGYKFNLLGWPLSVLAISNKASRSSALAWILTSTMEASHVEEALKGFARETRKVTNMAVDKPFLLSDSETSYQAGLQAAFGKDDSKTLMCYFHVVAAVKKYVQTHASGNQKSKDSLFQQHSRKHSPSQGQPLHP